MCPVEFGNPLCVAVLMEQKGPVHHHLREMLNREGAPLAYESCSGWHREPPLAARVGRAGATTFDKSRRAGHREAVGVTEMGWHAMQGASSARVKGGKKGSRSPLATLLLNNILAWIEQEVIGYMSLFPFLLRLPPHMARPGDRRTPCTSRGGRRTRTILPSLPRPFRRALDDA